MYRGLKINSVDQFKQAAKNYVGKVPSNGLLMPAVKNYELNDERIQIKEILTSQNSTDMPVEALYSMKNIIEIAIMLQEMRVGHFYLISEVLESIDGARRLADFSNLSAWRRAFDLAVRSLEKGTSRHVFSGTERIKHLAKNFSALSKMGYSYEINGYGVNLTQHSFRKLCTEIEKKIKRVGGINVIDMIFHDIDINNRIYDGSFMFGRVAPVLRVGNKSAELPWSYLYYVAVKHIKCSNKSPDLNKDMENIKKYAILLSSAFDVIPHSIFENIDVSVADSVDYIYETVIFDELFAFQQWQPLASQKILPIWLIELDKQGCSFPVASFSSWIAVSDRMIALSSQNSIRLVAESDFFIKAISRERNEKIFNSLLCPTGGVNQRYSTPRDTNYRDSLQFPLIRGPGNSVYLQPRAITARALCERLYALMRDNNEPDLENKMGRALEEITFRVLKDSGVGRVFRGGSYKNDLRNAEREVDIYVETEERIFLVECTKKPLTNKSRAGNTLKIFEDLSGSFFKMVRQMAEHEAHLAKRGEIQFSNGQKLTLGARSVEKIGISLFDHGSLQSRDTTINLLGALINAIASPTRNEGLEIIEKTNKTLSEIKSSILTLSSNADNTENAFLSFSMSTWWLSIDQLEYLSQKENNLWCTMKKLRHISTHSGDIIFDLCRLANLNDLGEQLLQVATKMGSRANI